MGKPTHRELVLLRHAKSDWYSGAATDFERPLNDRGRRDAPRMGQWMKEQGLVPEHIISSPAERARQTIRAVVAQLGLGERRIHWDERLYMADVPILLGVLAECPRQARRVMLVGHNPGLDELVDYLADFQSNLEAGPGLMKTAAVARLELPAAWQDLEPSCGRLLELVTPKTLGL